MNTYISLLRGINLGGHKKIKMGELKNLYEGLELADVETYVQSGNVVFQSKEADAAKVAGLIEAQIEQTLGYAVTVFMRRPADFQRLLDKNPFADEDPGKLHVTFLYREPSAEDVANLNINHDEGEDFVISGREIFLFCPNGYGRTKLSNNAFERKLKVPATTRNWKTVNALHALSQS